MTLLSTGSAVAQLDSIITLALVFLINKIRTDSGFKPNTEEVELFFDVLEEMRTQLEWIGEVVV